MVPGTLKVELSDIKGDASAELLSLVNSQVEKMILDKYNLLWEGDVGSLQTLPVESLMPVLLLKHLGSFATQMDISKDNIEYGFDPEGSIRKKPSKRKTSMLKEIESEFSTSEEGEDQAAMQLIVDENLINTYLLEFVMIDSSVSL